MFLAALALLTASIAWAGEKLEIVKAEYGASDKWANVTAAVQSNVKENVLKIEANNTLCTEDPAFGISKVLKITAKAGDKQALFLCKEGQSIEIKAETVIAEATKPKAPKVNLVIVSAEYGIGEKKTDVTKIVKGLVDDGAKEIAATNDLFGDPAEGEAKILTVKYKLDGKDATLSANENEKLNLP
jgi:hypothetical protein